MKKLSILLFLVFTSFVINAQMLRYNVVKAGKTIGILNASAFQEKNKFVYEMNTDVTVQLVAKMDLSFLIQTVFKDGILEESIAKDFINKKQDFQNVVVWRGKKYTIQKNKKKSKDIELETPVDYTLAVMYYQEPKERKQVFSERYGEYLQIKKIAPHKYELLMPNGKSNVYSYRADGICEKVEVSHSLGNFSFELLDIDWVQN